MDKKIIGIKPESGTQCILGGIVPVPHQDPITKQPMMGGMAFGCLKEACVFYQEGLNKNCKIVHALDIYIEESFKLKVQPDGEGE